MTRTKYFFSAFLCAVLFLCHLNIPVHAAITHDITTSSNWNIRIDGATANDKLGDYSLTAGDLNNNDIPDLVISVRSGSALTRTSVAITYIIFDDLLDDLAGTGNTIDLNTSSNWNIRYVGAATGDNASYYSTSISDLDNNSINDLLIAHAYGAHGGTSGRGMVYFIKDSLIDDYSSTGNTVDLATTTNFNTKYIGAATDDHFGSSHVSSQDFDNDGKLDLVITSADADNNSRGGSGSAYVIYNTLIDDYTSTGNVVNMATSSNYNLRYDGAAASNALYNYVIPGDGDLNNDDIDDLIFASPNADNAGSNTGSMYIIYNTLIDDYSNTGNTVDLATTTNFNIRIDGATDNGSTFGYSITNIVDLNDDDNNDLLIADSATSYNSRSYSGSVYILYNSLLSALAGTGNTLDLATSTSYNVRFDGSHADSYFGYDNWATDYNSDGDIDLIADNCCSNNSLFILYNSLFSGYTSTGNTVDMSSSANYSIVYTGPTNNQFDVIYSNVDLNGDGSKDLIVNDALADYNSRNNSGSNYIIYNFPHTFALSATTYADSTLTVSGTITASNSTTNISGVEYQIDSNTPSSGWESCTAGDGTFNSTSETFTCTTTAEPTTVGTHTVYIRAYDTHTSYSAQSNYQTTSYSISSPTSTPTPTSSPSSSSQPSSRTSGSDNPQIVRGSAGNTVTGGDLTPIKDSHTGGQNIHVFIDSNTFDFNAYLFSQKTSVQDFYNALNYVPVNTITTGINQKLLGITQACGIRWQVGNIQEIWYKTYPPRDSNKSPAKIMPSLQRKPSILVLGYTSIDLIPAGMPNAIFDPSLFEIAHSTDGVRWNILTSSVVDLQGHSVAARDTLGGYYMIVSGCPLSRSFNESSLDIGTAVPELLSTDPSKDQINPIQEELSTIPKDKMKLPQKQSDTPQSFIDTVIAFMQQLFK